jgi:hypothetical protein
MSSPKVDLKTKHIVDAARCNLEMALMLLNDLPHGLEELEITKTFVNDALFSSYRLSLEVALDADPLDEPYLRLVVPQDKAS